MFKRFIHLFKRALMPLLILILVGFTAGFFITSFVANNSFSYYEFSVNSTTDINSFFKEDNLNRLVSFIKEYNTKLENKEIEGKKLFISKDLDTKELSSSIKIKEVNENEYKLSIPMRLFTTTFLSKSQKLSEGIGKCERTMVSLIDSNVAGIDNLDITITSEFKHVGYHNPYLYGLIGGVILGALFIGIIIALSIKNGELKDHNIHDNIEIFKTPFHKRYWLLASKSLKTVKNIAVVAVLFALMMACKAIPIPSGFGALGISFTYLFFSIIAMLYGPITALCVGMLSDVLGHFIFPPGMPFFPGYTLDSMLAGFTYGLFFYKTRISFSKCFFARLIVNLFINTILGSIWWALINDFSFDAYLSYMLLISLPKNLIYLLPQSLLLFILLKALMSPLKHLNLVDYRICDNVGII